MLAMGLMACNSESNQATFEAAVLEADADYLLVEPVDGSVELNSADRIAISIRDAKLIGIPKVDSLIRIVYGGTIQESYPAQIDGVESIEVIGEANRVPKLNELLDQTPEYLSELLAGKTDADLVARWGQPNGSISDGIGDAWKINESGAMILVHYNENFIVEYIELANVDQE